MKRRIVISDYDAGYYGDEPWPDSSETELDPEQMAEEFNTAPGWYSSM